MRPLVHPRLSQIESLKKNIPGSAVCLNGSNTSGRKRPFLTGFAKQVELLDMLKVAGLILGLAIAAWGGVISYRALFLEPKATAVINEGTGSVHEFPSMVRVIGGLIMLAGGSSIAFFALRRKPR